MRREIRGRRRGRGARLGGPAAERMPLEEVPVPAFHRIASGLAAFVLLSAAPASRAAWVPDGNPLCNVPGEQFLASTARGTFANGPVSVPLRGMLVFWSHRTVTDPVDLFYGIVRETPPPDPAPGTDGTPFVIAAGSQGFPAAVAVEPIPSGAQSQGSAFVAAWTDEQRLRAKRIGDEADWGANGVAVAPADALSQSSPAITDDGGRGAIVAWLATTDAQRLVRAQRLDENGNLLWGAGGVPVGLDTTVQGAPGVARAPGGGIYVLRKDHRIAGTVGGPVSLALYRLDGGGVTAAGWPVAGVVIGGVNPWSYRLLEDGSGGVFVAWTGSVTLVDQSKGLEVRVTRIQSDGQPASGWSLAGTVAVGRDDGYCKLEDVDLDGTGGVVLAASYQRIVGGPSPTRTDLFVQRFLGDGTRPAAWPAAGHPLSAGPGDEDGARLIGQQGGLLAAWRDDLSSQSDLYALRLEPDGTPVAGWDPQGLLLCGAPSVQSNVQVAPNNSGGAVFAWLDWRSATGPDLYMQSLDAAGRLDVEHPPAGPLALSAPRPSPAHGPVELVLNANGTGTARVEVVDSGGRSIRRWSVRVGPGRNPITWRLDRADGARVAPGVYHLRVSTPWGERSRKVVVLT